ncbi:cysteine peptidase family C39 domain-containing protein (plasmid) [Shinella sp. H4-D48]|uniref:cysteine peptidase family C39 domain-containing protein n=1 Tax=Shinella sp. H4-D48 TaxID=2925841 RepID=UPI001F53816E|nr:cysteine peptidase family C39 domain-containing protein [Shinella sp. H4-D48]UNK39989.1 cysteine peptidase family C39 domain-containing protein [Shinella sp. H4-D48]
MWAMVFLARVGRLAVTGRKHPKTPEVRQGEHAECGLAALAIMLGHHGVHIPLSQLRQRAGSTLFGSTLRQLRHIAESYGFKANAHRIEPSGMAMLGFPLIAHMRFIHFVVVEKIGPSVVHLNDPGCGPVILERAEFDRDFTGITLSLTPVTALPRGTAFSFVHALLHAWKGEWVRLSFAGAVSMMAGSLAAAGIWRLVAHPTDGVVLLATSLCAAGLVVLLAEHANKGTRRRWTGSVFEALGGADNEHFLFTRPEQMLARFTALDDLQNTALGRAVLIALFLLAALATGCGLAPEPVLPIALLSAVQLALIAGAVTRRGGHIARYGDELPPAQGIGAEYLADADWYRIGTSGDGLFSHLAGMHARTSREYFRAAGEQRFLHTALFALDMAKIALPLHTYAGADLLLALCLAAGSGVLIRSVGRYLRSRLLKDALHKLGDLPTPLATQEPPRMEPSADGILRLEGAGWSADGRHSIIGELCCSLSPGHILFVHGPSGSGATTFARLTSGMLRPTIGTVQLDGRPLYSHPSGTAILVDHSAPIVSGTLRNNLNLGAEGIGDATMWNALGLVGLDEIMAKRGGLSYVIKPEQPRLSGGQLRRIAIARALCRAPRLLVLDEALDNVETLLARVLLARLRASGLLLVVTTKNIALVETGETVVNLGAEHVA